MNTYRLSKPAAHELAAHLIRAAHDRLAHLRAIANDPEYSGDSFGPEALHLFTEVSVLNQLGSIIDDIGSPLPLTIEDRESRECDGWAAEPIIGGFAIEFANHPIGDTIQEIARRDAETRARRLEELREQARDISRRITELEGC